MHTHAISILASPTVIHAAQSLRESILQAVRPAEESSDDESLRRELPSQLSTEVQLTRETETHQPTWCPAASRGYEQSQGCQSSSKGRTSRASCITLNVWLEPGGGQKTMELSSCSTVNRAGAGGIPRWMRTEQRSTLT